VKGSGACKLIGPAGEVELSEGVIVAKRHLHVTEEDAAAMGIKNGEIIKVACGGEGRKLIFDDVVVRVNVGGATTMHVDTDESQAANGPTVGELVRFIESKSAQTQGDDTPMTNLGREDDRFAKFLLAEVIRGEDLKNLREELNISGTVLATELGVSRSSVWSFENSNHPKRETVERAVTALKAIASRS
jgi:DNA-binding transcriptional regulator YiaG